MTEPWPHPGDTALDQSRKVALSYRSMLYQVAPELCAELDGRAITLGQGWIAPREIPEFATSSEALDAELSARDIEHFWRIPARTIWAWANKGLLEKRCANDGSLVYRVGDVLDCQARRADRGN